MIRAAFYSHSIIIKSLISEFSGDSILFVIPHLIHYLIFFISLIVANYKIVDD